VDLSKLQRDIYAWQRKNFGIQPPHRALLGVVEEVGELSHAHLKMEQGIRGTTDELALLRADAVGDILIYLSNYCSSVGLVMVDCLNDSWEEVSKRDWKKYPETGIAPKNHNT